ncbi:lysophospholipid acyltransferase family protein [Acidovorax radicis]|uniref:lysophospholipid acyltransferase family protein n=1 Tax=Acidovorax radicis TaxID=758826 RepID=UPI001CF7EFEC|nr:lysophospholipid acyltransferase family protein [Acidovorax radicis]UCU98537.1 1-acyl-sn-glycerol-3-phosphate acyltransferase [Acidovorax radicis]
MLAKLMSFLLLGIVRFLTGSQARWYGCPPKAEQRIYFANHQSHADMVLIWAALPEELRSITRPIAAKDYWTKTPFRQWITTAVFNAVYVDRQATPARPTTTTTTNTTVATEPAGAPAAPADADTATAGGPDPSPKTPTRAPSPEALRAALPASDPLAPLVRALESGDSIVIFPEGTRGHADEPQPFKSGLFKLAQMFPQVVLVPAWINNVQRVMPKGEVVPVPILCSVTFGTPIVLEAGEERRPFLDRARDAVIALRDV